jgi:hypothetical protein
VTDPCTARNISPTRVSVDGVLLEPDSTADVRESDAVLELAAHGALRLTRKPKPKPKTTSQRGRASRRSPDGEE